MTFFARNDDTFVGSGRRAGSSVPSPLTRGGIDRFAAALAERGRRTPCYPGRSSGYPGNHFRLGTVGAIWRRIESPRGVLPDVISESIRSNHDASNLEPR